MSGRLCLVTGATGFIGSHVAERLIQEGWRVRTIVRPTSDTSFIDKLGVEKVVGDLTDPETVRRAMEGVEAVVHCAAMVGDWGPVEKYRKVNVEAMRNLLEEAARVGVKRFVHISSLGVYEARDHYGTDESVEPPTEHIDGYTQTKVESEKLALQYHRERGLPVVVLRPGFVYGPRDRTVIPKLLEAIHSGRFRYFGSGEQAMNSIYVGNLVEAVLLALEKENAVGQVYNLTDDEPTSKKRFVGTLSRLAGLPEPNKHIPLWLAKLLANVLEWRARRKGTEKPPLVNKARVKFLGLNLDFSCEKAKRELGYRPRYSFEEGMRQTVEWFRSQGLIPGAKPESEATVATR